MNIILETHPSEVSSLPGGQSEHLRPLTPGLQSHFPFSWLHSSLKEPYLLQEHADKISIKNKKYIKLIFVFKKNYASIRYVLIRVFSWSPSGHSRTHRTTFPQRPVDTHTDRSPCRISRLSSLPSCICTFAGILRPFGLLPPLLRRHSSHTNYSDNLSLVCTC